MSTSEDLNDEDGVEALLDEVSDHHNCHAGEWLLEAGERVVDTVTGFFGADVVDYEGCPDDDGAFWLGMTRTWNNGRARTVSIPGIQDDNTLVSCTYRNSDGVTGWRRVKTAHEVGHLLGKAHVRIEGESDPPECPCHDHPHGGILQDVPFDPYWNQVIGSGVGSVFDFMSYKLPRWISGSSWERLIDPGLDGLADDLFMHGSHHFF